MQSDPLRRGNAHGESRPVTSPGKGNNIMTKYEQLTADLIAAKTIAAQFENEEDGGTCNFDTAALYLPRWNREQTEKAFEAAGLRTDKWKMFGSTYWMIFGCYSGQGNRRTTMAEAVCKYLKNKGYDATVYYQMD